MRGRGMSFCSSVGTLLSILCLFTCQSLALNLTAHVSMQGIRGTVSFSQLTAESEVMISTSIESTDNETIELSWSVREFPADMRIGDRCSKDNLGSLLVNFDTLIGPLSLPEKGVMSVSLPASSLPLWGRSGIWGRTLLIEGARTACGSIMPEEEEKVVEARFTTPVAGSVFFRSVGAGNAIETILYSSLYHVTEEKPVSSEHEWALYVTDILSSSAGKERENCNFLQILYDPDSREESRCSHESPTHCKEGNLGKKHGKVRVGARESRFSRRMYSDPSLILPDVKGPRSVYLVLFEKDHEDTFMACTKLRDVPKKEANALVAWGGVKGMIKMVQRSAFDVTHVTVKLTGLLGEAKGYHVHEYPVPLKTSQAHAICSDTAGHYNPYGVDVKSSPPPGTGTHDQYELGDLSGKHGTLAGMTDTPDIKYWDTNLPLFGSRSVIGRSIVIHKAEANARWACASLNQVNEGGIATAAVTFRYPLVGRIIFRQPADDALDDTTVYVESLIYSDGTKNDSADHRWHVHLDQPGKDFYNWSGRCLSAGPHFNPYKVDLSNSGYGDCSGDLPLRCEVGDLERKLGLLSVTSAGKRKLTTRRLFTDSNLPLSGTASILEHSIVIHDDKGPKARGDRLACSSINRIGRQKAVVKEWFGNGFPTPMLGKVEFIQESPWEPTGIEVQLSGLENITSGYHVHVAPVEPGLKFPCADGSVYGHFNPYNVTPSLGPAPSEGTPDQYEVGDMSGKFGTLAELEAAHLVHNDTNMALFGQNSIIGRSIVVHKKEKNERWTCGTVRRGYAPSEAYEAHAIVSFHHPGGFAYGYVLLSQLVYHDGSLGETNIEVNLKHPGVNNRNVTRNHNWAVFVNPVGQDAAVKTFGTRCVAGGYVWNPYFTQLADPQNDELYREECNVDNPLRCYVGDVSGRLGPISLGDKRQIFNDVNLPLDGPQSAMGKSIVIYNKDFRSEKFACANIEPYKDIVKYINIRKPPQFVESRFLSDVREVMGIPEWMLTVDTRKTQVVNNGKCIQFLLHFLGGNADKLEQDLSRLLIHGQQSTPSIYIPGAYPNPKRKTKLPYRTCRVSLTGEDDEDEDSNTRSSAPVFAKPTPLFAVFSVCIFHFTHSFNH